VNRYRFEMWDLGCFMLKKMLATEFKSTASKATLATLLPALLWLCALTLGWLKSAVNKRD
jgi:hypothetical protein